MGGGGERELLEDVPHRQVYLDGRATTGEMVCTVHFAPVKSRTLQVYWPEGNALISRRVDPISGEPDYKTVVKVERA